MLARHIITAGRKTVRVFERENEREREREREIKGERETNGQRERETVVTTDRPEERRARGTARAGPNVHRNDGRAMRNGETAETSGITKVTKGYFNFPARGASLIQRGLGIPGAVSTRGEARFRCQRDLRRETEAGLEAKSIAEPKRFRVSRRTRGTRAAKAASKPTRSSERPDLFEGSGTSRRSKNTPPRISSPDR